MKTPTDAVMRSFHDYQRTIKASRKRASTHIRSLCSQLYVMLEEYPCLWDLLDSSVAGTVRYYNR